MAVFFGPPGGGSGGGPAPLPSNQAIVTDGTTITLSPASGTAPAQGVANVGVIDNVATYRLAANRVALQSGATAPVQNSAGAAIGAGTITVAANAVSHVRLPATVAGVANSGTVSVRNSAGADPHPATAIVSAGALTGVNLAATVAMIDNGDTFTATNGQTILVAVADNVPSLTALPFPIWQPFTVTCGSDGFGGFGYSAVEGEEMGAISNEPVDGYSVETCAIDGSGNFYFYLRGPKPMSDILWGADIGIDTASYVFGPFNGQAAPSARLDGDVVSEAELSDVTQWTDGQIVPIVIIPQNGG